MESHPLRGDIKPNPRIPRIPDEFCQPAWTTEIISIIRIRTFGGWNIFHKDIYANKRSETRLYTRLCEGGWLISQKNSSRIVPFRNFPWIDRFTALPFHHSPHSVLILLSIETIVIGSFYTSPWFQTHLSSNLLIATLCIPFYSRVWKRLWSIMGAQTCTIHVSARVPSILYNQI